MLVLTRNISEVIVIKHNDILKEGHHNGSH